MAILIGIFLILPVIGIIHKANQVRTKKKTRLLCNLSLAAIALLFFAFCFIVPSEPFDFQIEYSLIYMLYRGSYITYAAVIFVWAPFMWVIVFHFARMIFRSVRVRKNARIRREEEYTCYRDDLDKISPALLAFVSTLEVDCRKSIAATLLKLKCMGYIGQEHGGLVCVQETAGELSESEQMVFDLISRKTFNKNRYIRSIESEALKNKYLRKNSGGIPARIWKMIFAVCVPILMICTSMRFDQYVFENYYGNPHNDGTLYIELRREEDIDRLYSEVEDVNDYYHSPTAWGWDAYSYNQIRADKLQYGVVRKAWFLQSLNALLILASFVSICISAYRIAEQIANFHKNYKRTNKGKVLLNKAYALKNYLRNYSLIRERTEKELALWQDYLIYAAVLGVNEKVGDEVIEKYVKTVI